MPFPYLRLDLKNKFYVDLNIIYPFFDILAPNKISSNEEDLKSRMNAIAYFLKKNDNGDNKVKFLISKSVYIEWFQKIITINMENGESYNSFIKTERYKEIIKRFKSVHKKISNSNSIFEFEWNFPEFIEPENQSWDHFHITMRENSYKFISFDKKFSKNKDDFIHLKKR